VQGEPTKKTKTDVLDLIISFIIEHEKEMDSIVTRLEKVVERLAEDERLKIPELEELQDMEPQPETFSLTINKPKNFPSIKSINIDWEEGRE